MMENMEFTKEEELRVDNYKIILGILKSSGLKYDIYFEEDDVCIDFYEDEEIIDTVYIDIISDTIIEDVLDEVERIEFIIPDYREDFHNIVIDLLEESKIKFDMERNFDDLYIDFYNKKDINTKSFNIEIAKGTTNAIKEIKTAIREFKTFN